MRAIDADALIEFIENRYDITWKCDYEGGIKDACTDILEKISKMPIIEPERKKGKWIRVAGMNEQCSVCDKYFPLSYFAGRPFEINYCPNCGADLRGDNDDTSK